MDIIRTPKNCWSPGRPLSLLNDILDSQVAVWLPQRVKDLILDYQMIKEHFMEYGIGNSSLSDFSYLVTPAFKALEGTLIEIATQLGFNLGKDDYKVGVIFDEGRLEKYYQDVLEKLEGMASDNKLDVKQWLSNAKRLLYHLRHAPAHFGGEGKASYTEAIRTGEMIVFTVNEMCKSLLVAGLLKPGGSEKVVKVTL